jgi:hypothetical protein
MAVKAAVESGARFTGGREVTWLGVGRGWELLLVALMETPLSCSLEFTSAIPPALVVMPGLDSALLSVSLLTKMLLLTSTPPSLETLMFVELSHWDFRSGAYCSCFTMRSGT